MNATSRAGALGLILTALLAGSGPASSARDPAPPGQRAGPAAARPAATDPARKCPTSADCSQPCYGAAARDPAVHPPCVNRKLEYAVVPTPRAAAFEFGDHCTTKERTAVWWLCAFGPLPGLRTFAVVGDSHAGHWRPGLANVAYAKNWRGISITKAGCPFSRAAPDLPSLLAAPCLTWNRMVVAWFTAHPEADAVFLSEHAGAGVKPAPGKSALATKVAGYLAAWASLPPSVKHIVVIRDTPLNTSQSQACIEHAIARHLRAGAACAVPLARALHPDPQIAAVAAQHSPRVQVIDLTPLFCGARACFPVIGGVLVHSDIDHLTSEFSATLGTFILRQLDRLIASGSWAPTSPPAAKG